MKLYARYLRDRWGYNYNYAEHIGGGEPVPVTRHNFLVDITFGTYASGQFIEGSFGTSIKANDGYVLPVNVTVKSGGTVLSASDYTYDRARGIVTVASGKTNKDIEITGECVELMSWNKVNNMTWNTMNETDWSEINS